MQPQKHPPFLLAVVNILEADITLQQQAVLLIHSLGSLVALYYPKSMLLPERERIYGLLILLQPLNFISKSKY